MLADHAPRSLTTRVVVARPCVTYAQIAKRFGVTRERCVRIPKPLVRLDHWVVALKAVG